ncbi:1-phosphofructokinase [Streptococcus sp. zg-86]|uniref:Tagatose-6-phosphate kinase n=1 Tax=Streptococcus zhangguiae TaxID=2664091 RepID=A0A6I4RF64_9STRE|nr:MULTISPECIES: 1-phosphofructokinase [unclassified Streptococcus]MTB63575.1 1-phosphofructokinase [Streptococcus sp. zg-86]MTB89776.1 1-phosphofructokinase [Streptococcus sp. zg-36]MWV55447.1 1-phosphofructokinase [Streptococcus sp. zg-70]QTH47640.1 1-phosphofructokinase [Streptococcus sp. zg-86]
MAIYTCTMNLAIDLVIETQEMLASKVNRTSSSDIQANGKGVNVSFILKQLGIDSTAIGFSGGFTGRYIKEVLDEKGISHRFVEVDGLTRVNVFTKVVNLQQEFKLVNQGPIVSQEAQEELLKQIEQMLAGDYLIVSGSLPQGVGSQVLIRIAQICSERKIRLILDSSDPIVRECLPYAPYLLKPNDEELAAWYQLESMDKDQAIQYAQKLVEGGARHVLMSLGEKGAVFIDSDLQVYECNAPKGEVVNTACSGDTLLATFLAGLLKEKPIPKCLVTSVAAGSSTAFRTGLTDFSDVKELEQQIKIKKQEV